MAEAHLRYRISVDISDAMAELRRLDEPDLAVHLAFEATARRQFAQLRRQIHRSTGRLAASAREDIDYQHGLWTAELTVGEGLDYAKAELARGHDHEGNHADTHYFFEDIDDGDPGYDNVILDHYRGL